MAEGITRARYAELEAKEKRLAELEGKNKSIPETKNKTLSVDEISLKEESDKHKDDFEKEEEIFRCGVCGELTKNREKCDSCGVEFE